MSSVLKAQSSIENERKTEPPFAQEMKTLPFYRRSSYLFTQMKKNESKNRTKINLILLRNLSQLCFVRDIVQHAVFQCILKVLIS